MEHAGVFGSTCGIQTIRTENNLLELLQHKVVSDKPLEQDVTTYDEILRIPEKRQKLPHKPKIKKVKTVRDIRNEYEKYVYANLKPDLIKQKQALYDKIRNGSLRKNTLDVVTRILNSNDSIARTTWNMITDLNPNNHLFNKQYVICNGLKIKVNGSLGGSKDIIYNDNFKIKRFRHVKHKKLIRKKSLIYNSSAPNFRPGPLSQKYLLDESYQKYNIGECEIINLPKIRLEIEPLYGAVLEPRIANYILGMREENGVLTEKWAEFATSTVGTVVNNTVVQCAKDLPITFDVGYNNNQNRILMRNFNLYDNRKMLSIKENNKRRYGDKSISVTVKSVVDKMIESVIVSINQDVIDYDLNIPNELEESELSYLKNNREKVNKNAELERLDVTIIRLAEDGLKENIFCGKLYCKLGCICSSLQCRFVIRDHCGKEECMFNCTCNYVSRVTESDLGYNSELINLNNKLHPRLAKEEQKFHQTVVVSNDKSILLNSHKRSIHNSACISKHSYGQLKELRVSIIPLSLKNVQTFCMVHELYKCFCKNRFVESFYSNSLIEETSKSIITTSNIDEIMPSKKTRNSECNYDEGIKERNELFSTTEVHDYSIYKQPNPVNSKNKTNRIKKKIVPYKDRLIYLNHTRDFDIVQINTYVDSCCRIMPYSGRKFSLRRYKMINSSIKELEDNDIRLRNKLLKHQTELIGDDVLDIPESFSTKKTTHGEPFSNMVNNELINGSIINDDIEKTEYPINTNEVTEDSVYRQTKSFNGKNKTNRIKKKPEPSPYKTHINLNHSRNFDIAQVDSYKIMPYSERMVGPQRYKIINSGKGKLSNLDKYEILKIFVESHYKQYKKRMADGTFKMENPVQRKLSLIPWNTLLERYKNKSNYFFVTTSEPFRFFMSVDPEIKTLGKCINIDDIKVCDLHKYSTPLKKLITQESNDNEEFCISYAQSGCWELIGCVQKLGGEHVQDNGDIVNYEVSVDYEACNVTLDNNKWFMMELEKGFEEVRLVGRGFFVKSPYLLKSIDVAQLSGSLKKLSPRVANKSNDTGLQFGIYIIPVLGKSRILIGPYGIHEDHGIELKLVNAIHKFENVKGQWITTKKEENKDILINPLMFLPHTNMLANIKNQEGNLPEKKIDPIMIKLNNDCTYLVVDSQGIVKPMSMVKPSVKDNDVNTQICNTLPVQTTVNCQIPSTSIERFTLKNENTSAAQNFTTRIDTIIVSDEEEINEPSADESSCIPVWIQCVSITSLGCLVGKKNKNNNISFTFPTFKPTAFLSEFEAFKRINEILLRVVYVPQNIEIKWKVVEKNDDLINRNLLNIKDFGEGYILTEEGIIHRSKLSAAQRMELLLPVASAGTTETIDA